MLALSENKGLQKEELNYNLGAFNAFGGVPSPQPKIAELSWVLRLQSYVILFFAQI